MRKEKFEKVQEIFHDFGIDIDLENGNGNLFEYGISSLQLMKAVSRLRKSGFRCTFAGLISHASIEELREYLIQSDNEKSDLKIKIPEKSMEEPFELTDVQYAYWIGRKGGQQIGNVGCHGYMEVDCKNLDTERLDKAFYQLQMHHNMLRAAVTEDGLQHVTKKPYSEHITVYDCKDKSKQEIEEHFLEMREKYSHRLLDIANGQVIAMQVTELPDENYRLHFDIDLLIADVTSFQIILRDLERLYSGKTLDERSHNFNFAQFIANEKEFTKQEREKDREYWKSRLENLSGKPELPMSNKNISKPRFTRLEHSLDPVSWKKFKEKCKDCQVTPAIALLTIYGMVIAKYSENKKFLMNLPLFNRTNDMQGMEDAVADFTKLLLMEMDFSEKKSLLHQILSVKQEFQDTMSHNAYHGMDVIRDYQALHKDEKMVAPIVFSCNLGVPLLSPEFISTFGGISYMISQTPQVWLDFQLFDLNDGLYMIWDSVEGIFQNGVVEEMFSAYQKLLRTIAETEDWNQPVFPEIENSMKVRKSFELSDQEKLGHLLHEGFFEKAFENPEAAAVTDSKDNRKYTYSELASKAVLVCEELKKRSIKKENCIGICLPRGIDQIACVLGILLAGGSYVTIGYMQPEKRRERIVQLAEIKYVITDDVNEKFFANLTDCFNVNQILSRNVDIKQKETFIKNCISETDSEQLAYVIFTSGSTGEPKGVEITHSAAMNTILDVNERFGISSNDRCLQVSAMDFDLSVYDIFGMLNAGAGIVMIEQGKEVDSQYLYESVIKNNVTVWNSVPALLELMLLNGANEPDEKLPLRLALISGDWIAMDLPEKFFRKTKDSTFISLGGATEGSIWSNYQNVTLPMPDEWSSIPYGHPLTNQKYRVLDSLGEDCPNEVRGELYIGGAGIARGYINNQQETEKHFVDCNGEIWYRTGDYGKFHKDGTIEFLGRADFQIKIRGHRIEIEEIERNLEKIHGVKQALVLPVGSGSNSQLAAVIISDDSKENTAEPFILKLPTLSEEYDKAETLTVPSDEKVKQYVASKINSLMNKFGFTDQQTNSVSEDTILNKRIQKKYVRLVQKWSDFCKENKNDFATLSLDIYDDFVEKILSKADEVMIQGKSVAETYFMNGDFSVSDFALKQPGAEIKCSAMIEAVSNNLSENSRVLIIGARNEKTVLKLIETVLEKNSKAVLLDSDSSRLKKIENIFQGSEIKTGYFDEKEFVGNCFTDQYDMLLSVDFLHTVSNLYEFLGRIQKHLRKNGLLIASEVTKNSPVQLITTAIIENGFSCFTDFRKDSMKPLLTFEQWKNVLQTTGFSYIENYIPSEKNQSQQIILAVSDNLIKVPDLNEIKENLRNYVPEYMVPKMFYACDNFPKTSNGKIDRKMLVSLAKEDYQKIERTAAKSEIGKKVCKVWSEILKVDNVYLEDDFYAVGGDSLIAVRVKNRLQEVLGFQVSLEDIFTYSVCGDFISQIESKIDTGEKTKSVQDSQFTLVVQPDKLYETFPMTDVQYAYYIGRTGGYALGNVSAHCYFEMEGEAVREDKLNVALRKLIEIHPMMRCIILPDGTGQKILENVPDYFIAVNQENETSFEELKLIQREEMSKEQFDVTKWPLFDIRVTYNAEKSKMCMHFSFDNVVFDGFSIFHLFAQWKDLTDGKEIDYTDKISFRDYVCTKEILKKTEQYNQDLAYWKERAKTLPPAPSLPVLKSCEDEHFTRFEMTLNSKKVNAIRALQKKYHLTLPVILMTAYSEVLARYSSSRHFTLNLTRFEKLPLHEDVDKLIGDFTSLTLLEINFKNTNNFLERCNRVKAQLLADMQHSLVSGVEVERELVKISGNSQLMMPVVFTSGIGIRQEGQEGAYFGDITYGESQTPQVWLDHQVSIQNGEMKLSWDAVLQIFPEGMVQEMWEMYICLLESLCEEETYIKPSVSLIQVPKIAEIEKHNNIVSKCMSDKTIVSAFLESARKFPNNIAVQSMNESITYQKLEKLSKYLAGKLIESGIKKGDCAAIYLPKSPMQVVAAAAIMLAGGIYVPLDIHNPSARIESILKTSGAKAVILLEKQDFQADLQYIEVGDLYSEYSEKEVKLPDIEQNDSAYVIFTSGSTGIPKGVEISHKGAMNTIADINKRFNVNENDASLMLSNLNFDLSVYDLFGMLSCGGKIVIPDEDKRKDPEHFEKLLKLGVTVWNTVPAFMQMMTEYHKGKKIDCSLRLVLLSGDWIGLSLPESIRNMFGQIEIVSLGGATECSIWSNCYVIGNTIPESWKSIPYGRPLNGQGFLILNEEMERTPVGVPGELYIFGYGLAKGYLNDSERTAESFIYFNDLERLIYKTGDFGRYMNDGNIEFLGRKDNQVKRSGHRIELGEIEAGLQQMKGIEQAAVTYIPGEEDSLTAHIITDDLHSLFHFTIEMSDNMKEVSEICVQDIETEISSKMGAYCDKRSFSEKQALISITEDCRKWGITELCKDYTSVADICNVLQIAPKYEIFLGNLMLEAAKAGQFEVLEKSDGIYYKTKSERIACETDESELLNRLNEGSEIRLALLQQKEDIKNLMVNTTDKLIYPNELSAYMPEENILQNVYDTVLKTYGKTVKGSVLEISSRIGKNTEKYASYFENAEEYIYADESLSMLEIVKENYENHGIACRRFNVSEPDFEVIEEESISVIIADNTIHRFNNVDKVLRNLAKLLVPGGCIVMVENTRNSPLMLQTTAYFEDLYTGLEDDRVSKGLPLMNYNEWTKKALSASYSSLEPYFNQDDEKKYEGNVYVIHAEDSKKRLDKHTLKEKLSSYLPSYMMPVQFVEWEQFPLTANGKIDRKLLASFRQSTVHKNDSVKPSTPMEITIAGLWKELLEVDEVSADNGFFELGGDSLKAIRFMHRFAEVTGREITLQMIAANPILKDLAFAVNETVTEDEDEEWDEVEEII